MDSNNLVLRASYPNWVAEFPVSLSGAMERLKFKLAQRLPLVHKCTGQECKLTELEALRLEEEAKGFGIRVEWV